jgi:hypothetical protein
MSVARLAANKRHGVLQYAPLYFERPNFSICFLESVNFARVYLLKQTILNAITSTVLLSIIQVKSQSIS